MGSQTFLYEVLCEVSVSLHVFVCLTGLCAVCDGVLV